MLYLYKMYFDTRGFVDCGVVNDVVVDNCTIENASSK